MVQPYPLEFLCHVCASSCRSQCAFPANSQHQVCLSEDCSLAVWSRKASSWKCTSLGAVFSQWWLSVRMFFAPSGRTTLKQSLELPYRVVSLDGTRLLYFAVWYSSANPPLAFPGFPYESLSLEWSESDFSEPKNDTL